MKRMCTNNKESMLMILMICSIIFSEFCVIEFKLSDLQGMRIGIHFVLVLLFVASNILLVGLAINELIEVLISSAKKLVQKEVSDEVSG